MKPEPGGLCAVGTLAVALAVQICHGADPPAVLLLAGLGTLLAVAAAIWLLFRPPAESPLLVQCLLGFGGAAGLAGQLFFNPVAPQAGFRWMATGALVLLSAYLCLHLRASLMKARFLLLLACFLVMGLAVLRESPQPANSMRALPLLAMLGAAWALSRARPGPTGELAALFLLFQPRTLVVLEQERAEPLVLAAFAASLWALLRTPKRLVAAPAAASAAAAWLVFVLLNQQAFCNYEWLGAGLLCTAAAAGVREGMQ